MHQKNKSRISFQWIQRFNVSFISLLCHCGRCFHFSGVPNENNESAQWGNALKKCSCGGENSNLAAALVTWNWIIVEYLQPIFSLSGKLPSAAAQFNKQISDKAAEWCSTTLCGNWRHWLSESSTSASLTPNCMGTITEKHIQSKYIEWGVNCQLAAALSNQTGTLELEWPDTCVT